MDYNSKIVMLKGADGAGIKDIKKTSTNGLTDTYTITLTDGQKHNFDVTNGKSIKNIEKSGTSGLVDTYKITFNDGTTQNYTVSNGKGISSISKTGANGLVDTYTITLNDGDTTTFDVTNGASIESIELTSSDNYVDTYTVNLTDGTTTSFNVTNGQAYTIPKDSVVYYEGNDTPDGYVDTNPPSGSGDFAQIDDTAPSSSKVYSSNKINTDYPFKFGVDDNGNYGYYKAGADTVTPFKSAKASGIGDIHNGFGIAAVDEFVYKVENSMAVSINDSIKFTWKGGNSIGAQVKLVPRIDKIAKKIKYKATTGTSYSSTIENFKISVGVISEKPSYTEFTNTPQAYKKYNVYAENNAIFEGELDISDIDSDLYLIITASGWNVEFTELTIE